MMYLIRISTIALLSIFVVSCNSDDIQIVNVDSTLIAKDNLYGNGAEEISEQNLVITDQTTWSELMTKMNAVNNTTDIFSETNIDFSEYQIIAVFDDIKGNGGHEIGLNIVNDSENIIVTITDLIPGGNVASVITQPFHIVKIPVSSLPIIFE